MKIDRRLPAAVLAAVMCTAGTALAEQPAVAAPTPIPYGAGAEIAMDGGRVKFVVSAPEVVNFHKDEYDAASPTLSKAGALIGSMVRVRVSAQGVSGEASAISVDMVYEAPDGLLAGTEFPPYAYEKTDMFVGKPSPLTTGQRIVGEVYFASKAGGGKVIASSSGTRQAIWRP